MKKRLLTLGLFVSVYSFAQEKQSTEQEVVKPTATTTISATSVGGATVKQVRNEGRLDVKKIGRNRVSEKKQVPVTEKKEPSNN
jgi:hypothetical protein